MSDGGAHNGARWHRHGLVLDGHVLLEPCLL